MEKKKVSSRFSKRQFWGCFGFLLFGCFGVYGLLSIVSILSGKISQKSLAPDVFPTAEGLLILPYHVTLSDDISFELTVMENFYGANEDVICIYAWYEDESKLDAIRDNSSLFIDETWIMGASQTNLGWGVEVANIDWCASGELQAGIHLIEFHLKDSFWGEAIHIQQWAIEID